MFRKDDENDKEFNNEIIRFSELESKEIEWLWKPYIPLGKITMLAADPGSGKTFLASVIASIVSNGQRFPFSEEKASIGKTIFQNGEDGVDDTIKPRLEKANANCENIIIINENNIAFDLSQYKRLERILAKEKPKLVVIDPIQQYIGVKNMNNATYVREVLSKIVALANKYNCAVLIVCHLNKGDAKIEYRLLGSVDFYAIARSVLVITNIDETNEKVLEQIKMSVTTQGEKLKFKITDNGLEWIGKTDDSYYYKEELNEKSKVTEVIMKVIEVELKKGNNKATEVMEYLKKIGFSESSIKRAKKQLGVNSYKENNSSYWKLPDDDNKKSN